MLAEGRCATLSQPVAPQVTTSMGRTDAKVVAYNSQAFNSLTIAATASNTKLLVDDLYAAVDGKCGKNCAKDPLSTLLSSTLMLTLRICCLCLSGAFRQNVLASTPKERAL